MGRPNKTTILDRLATMREAAMFVNKCQRSDSFGHLILLLRDVPSGEEKAHNLVFGKENPDSAGSRKEAQHIVARNKARDLLQESFQTIRVVCLPLPHADVNGGFTGSIGCSVSTRVIPAIRVQWLPLDRLASPQRIQSLCFTLISFGICCTSFLCPASNYEFAICRPCSPGVYMTHSWWRCSPGDRPRRGWLRIRVETLGATKNAVGHFVRTPPLRGAAGVGRASISFTAVRSM